MGAMTASFPAIPAALKLIDTNTEIGTKFGFQRMILGSRVHRPVTHENV